MNILKSSINNNNTEKSDKPKMFKGSSENLINKNQVIGTDSNISLVVENQNKHTVEVQQSVPILITKPTDDDTLMNFTKPAVDGRVGQKNSKFRVKIEDRIFEIDRDTIYNKSKFFRNILLKRELPNETPFILEGVKYAAFEPISTWMHSGEIAIGPENIGNILEVAIKLEIEDIVKTCLQFRDLMLESAGLMRTYELASKYGMTDMRQAALRRMQTDFKKLAKSKAFLNFDVDQVRLLLDDSDLHIDSEIDVLNTCICWLTANWNKRQEHFISALDCVRFPLLSTTTLVNLATGGEDNESQHNKEIWRRVDTQKKVSDAFVFKAGLQCNLPRKVAYLKPKLRKNMKRKCSFGSLNIEKLDDESQAVIKLQAGLRGYNSRKLLAQRNEAAKKIQDWYRHSEVGTNKILQNISASSILQYILVLDKQQSHSNKQGKKMHGN